MNGNTGVAELPDVKVDADHGDIFSNLQMGAILCFEAVNNKWAVKTDFIYMDLGQDVKTGQAGMKRSIIGDIVFGLNTIIFFDGLFIKHRGEFLIWLRISL